MVGRFRLENGDSQPISATGASQRRGRSSKSVGSPHFPQTGAFGELGLEGDAEAGAGGGREAFLLVDGRARPLSRRAITDWVVLSYIAHNGTCSLCAHMRRASWACVSPAFARAWMTEPCSYRAQRHVRPVRSTLHRAQHCYTAHNGTCSLCAPNVTSRTTARAACAPGDRRSLDLFTTHPFAVKVVQFGHWVRHSNCAISARGSHE
jgi:hypothetical protein